MSELEELLALQIRAAKLPPPEREYKFITGRRFRFDFSWPERLVAVEVDGGLYINGAHSRGSGRESDYEKDALAMILGWRVLRVSASQVKKGLAISWIEKLLY